MTRFRLSLAVCMAILLIGVATWKRFETSTTLHYNLAAVPRDPNAITQADLDNAALAEGYADLNSGTTTATSSPNLSDTDLMGRQLMINFLGMAANGEATDDNIGTLANGYADSITTLSNYTPATLDELNVVADSTGSFSTYGQKISIIYNKYHDLTGDTVRKSGDMSDSSGPGFEKGMSGLANLYAQAAKELMSVPVPSSLADEHLKLVNNYLSSSNSFKDLSMASQDSSKAYGALTNAAEDSANEGEIIGSIQSSLVARGATLDVNLGS